MSDILDEDLGNPSQTSPVVTESVLVAPRLSISTGTVRQQQQQQQQSRRTRRPEEQQQQRDADQDSLSPFPIYSEDESSSDDEDVGDESNRSPIERTISDDQIAAAIREALVTPLDDNEDELNNGQVPFNSAVSAFPPDLSEKDESSEYNRFLMDPVPLGRVMLCRLLRRIDEKTKATHFELFLEASGEVQQFLLRARKRKNTRVSTYTISDSQSATGRIIGFVRSNFLGTAYSIYDNGEKLPLSDQKRHGSMRRDPTRKEHACTTYVPNVLGYKGPRKITTILPAITMEGKRIDFQPRSKRDSLFERFKQGNDPNVISMKNKVPQWSEESQSYVLNFHGRVTLASVKNFQIVHDHDLDYIALQFGRVGERAFTLDVRYPFSIFQAFGIALTSFDPKIACE